MWNYLFSSFSFDQGGVSKSNAFSTSCTGLGKKLLCLLQIDLGQRFRANLGFIGCATDEVGGAHFVELRVAYKCLQVFFLIDGMHEGLSRFRIIERGMQMVRPQPTLGSERVDDFDNDGLLDIVVSSWDPAGQIRFFHNDGDGTFSDQTDSAGLTGIFGGLNLIQADYDNDSDVDVLVLRGGWLSDKGRHPNSLLQNDGKGHFRDVTFESGLGKQHFPTQTASWADYDNDGDLDLYIGNEQFANQLFQNQGDGSFVDATASPLDDPGSGQGVAWGDYDDDGDLDLYLANAAEDANKLFQNTGAGTFVESPYKRGSS